MMQLGKEYSFLNCISVVFGCVENALMEMCLNKTLGEVYANKHLSGHSLWKFTTNVKTITIFKII